MGELSEIYDEISDHIAQDEFERLVSEKIELMGGLCDERTAAMLVMHDLGLSAPMKIEEIGLDKSNVSFAGAVTQISDVREFSRDDGAAGKVANLTVSDDTGSIRVVLWDDDANTVVRGEIKTGTRIQISGYVKEGYTGVEVNVGRNGNLQIMGGDAEVETKYCKTCEVQEGMSSVNLIAKVLDVAPIKEFSRSDGSTGRVANLTIGDETGNIRVALWDEQSARVSELEPGDTVEIYHVYARDGYSGVELNLGRQGSIRKTDADVDYEEKITGIGDIGLEGSHNIIGDVTGIDTIREFIRKNGKQGKVANIHVTDDTGRIRVALWDEHAEFIEKLDIGTQVKITDAYVKPGWNNEVELNLGSRGKIELIKT